MLHYRTIRDAARYFKDHDPQTAITESAIRRLVRSGAVPSRRVGNKYLVAIEHLEAYGTAE